MHGTKLEAITSTEIGKYVFFGECAQSTKSLSLYDTVSVSIFPVLTKSSGKGKKAGRGILRIKGFSSEFTRLNYCAEYICNCLNEGKFSDIPEIKFRALRVKKEWETLNGKLIR